MTSAKSTLLKSSTSRRTVGLLGRFGYAARGAIYLMIGISAGRATFDPSHRPAGFTSSLQLFQQHWSGAIVLVVLAVGMACLASWLTVSAIYRRDHPGQAHYALVAGLLGDAAIYVGFMGGVLGLLFGATGGEDVLQSWIGWVLASEIGRVGVCAAALIIFVCGAGLIAWGMLGDIEGPLELPPAEKRAVLPVGRYGTIGRGAAIVLVGTYILIAGIHGKASEAHELGGVLADLRDHSYGAVATGLFALAFIASSILDFIIAIFRRFEPRGG